MSADSVKIDIIGGFLGAGKTTFINKLIADGLGAQRVAIIENEFGKEAIDDTLVQSDSFDMRTLASGCICCTLKMDFITSISDIVNECQPDRIIIEPTGLAGPDELEATCKMKALQTRLSTPVEVNSMTTIVDATDVAEMIDYEIPVYLQQLEQARFIVLSHTQEMDAAALAEAHEAIRPLAQRAQAVLDTPWSELDGLEILELSAQAYADSAAGEDSDPEHADDHENGHGDSHEHDHGGNHEHTHPHMHGHAGFSSVVLHPDDTFDPTALEQLRERLVAQDILRAKGFLKATEGGMLHYEFVNGRASAEETSYSGDPKLVVIGRGFDADALLP